MPNIITAKRLAEIKARVEAATPPPWEWSGEHNDDLLRLAHGYLQGWSDGFPGFDDDKGFIVNSRTDIPDLIATLERAVELLWAAHRGTAGTTVRALKEEIATFFKKFDNT